MTTQSLTPQITTHSFEPVGLGCRRVCLDSAGVFKAHLLTHAGWEPQELVGKDEELAKFHITMTGPHHRRSYYTTQSSTGTQRVEVFGDENWSTVYQWSVHNDMGEWLTVPAETLSLRERCQLLMQLSLQVATVKTR